MATEQTTLHLPTLHCEGCMRAARQELERVGATVESSDIATKCVIVQFDPERVTRRDLEATMEAVGFPPEQASER